MAAVTLANLYEPLTFNSGVAEAATQSNAFYSSGVLQPVDELTNMASAGGKIGEMPFFKPVDHAAEPDYVSDVAGTLSVPANITTGKQIWRLAKMHKSWATMDFARELSLRTMDPLGAVINTVGLWWATQESRRLVSSTVGLIADNIANDAGDMVVNIYSDIAVPLAANIISANAVINAQQTAGDNMGVFTAIAMHSVTYSSLKKQNLISFIPNSRGEVVIPMYLGLAVTVDDTMPVTAGTNSPKYTTILFSPGSFGYGDGIVAVPSEMERIAGSGNGGGQDVIHVRKSLIIHPAGYQFKSTSVAGPTATLAELAMASNWDRMIARKNVGIAAITHNN